MSWFRFVRAVLRGEHRIAPMGWVSLAAVLIYTVSPIDLVPEFFLPIVGYIDDVGLWGFFLIFVTREKNRWDASLNSSALDVEGHDKGA